MRHPLPDAGGLEQALAPAGADRGAHRAVGGPVRRDAARIGPNAITRLAEVLPAIAGAERAEQVFAAAGLLGHWRTPPEAMVDEAEVARLHAALRTLLGDGPARTAARAAGARTADYLLAHRIPRLAQAVIERLPAAAAARLLLRAIGGHAWTFAGSGEFRAQAGRPLRFSIRGNPLCRGAAGGAPACSYYAATFERLFRTLVHRSAQVAETACEACGDDACRFEIRW
jgi:divinyl protochlorophyllide a 8-vinyl-reductase